MTTYVSPYTATVTSTTADGLAVCSFVDGKNQPVPDGTVLTTGTYPGQPGQLQIRFVEANSLQLVGAVANTVGGAPALGATNMLTAARAASPRGGYVDTITLPWAADTYTTRGVVLMFAQVDANGMMVNMLPTSDPQVRNDQM